MACSWLRFSIAKQADANDWRHRGNVGSAVITVPAYFNDAQRQATKAGAMSPVTTTAD